MVGNRVAQRFWRAHLFNVILYLHHLEMICHWMRQKRWLQVNKKLKCQLLAAYRGFALIFGTVMALITLADKLLLEIMKTQSHFLNWIYRNSKCLLLWPISLLERECFFLLTYLQRVIEGFYPSAEAQGPSCHPFCSWGMFEKVV